MYLRRKEIKSGFSIYLESKRAIFEKNVFIETEWGSPSINMSRKNDGSLEKTNIGVGKQKETTNG